MAKKVAKKKIARKILKKKKKVVQQADSAPDTRGRQKPDHTLHARTNRGGHPAAADQRTC
jgi:hypothetical protein